MLEIGRDQALTEQELLRQVMEASLSEFDSSFSAVCARVINPPGREVCSGTASNDYVDPAGPTAAPITPQQNVRKAHTQW